MQDHSPTRIDQTAPWHQYHTDLYRVDALSPNPLATTSFRKRKGYDDYARTCQR